MEGIAKKFVLDHWKWYDAGEEGGIDYDALTMDCNYYQQSAYTVAEVEEVINEETERQLSNEYQEA